MWYVIKYKNVSNTAHVVKDRIYLHDDGTFLTRDSKITLSNDLREFLLKSVRLEIIKIVCEFSTFTFVGRQENLPHTIEVKHSSVVHLIADKPLKTYDVEFDAIEKYSLLSAGASILRLKASDEQEAITKAREKIEYEGVLCITSLNSEFIVTLIGETSDVDRI